MRSENRKETRVLKRVKTLFVGIGLCAAWGAICLLTGCSSAPSTPDQTPDPAKAATPVAQAPNATPATAAVPDAKTMMKMRKEGGGPPPK